MWHVMIDKVQKLLQYVFLKMFEMVIKYPVLGLRYPAGW